MVKTSSRAVPYIVIALVVLPVAGAMLEIPACVNAAPGTFCGISEEILITLMATLGIAGAAKSAVGKAAAIRRAIPAEVEADIINKVKAATTPRTQADIDVEIEARVQAELRRRGVVDPNRRGGEF